MTNQDIPKKFYTKSNAYALRHTLIPLTLILLLVVVVRLAPFGLSWLFLFIMMGMLQYRLYFPLHDCTHYSLFATPWQNKLMGCLLAGILFTSFESFRSEHMKHHQALGTQDDPGRSDYWVHFKSRRELITFLLAPLWCGTLLVKIKEYYGSPFSSPRSARSFIIPGMAQLVLFFISSPLMEPWRYFLFIMLPAMTLLLFFSRLRMFLEHGSLNYSHFDYMIQPKPLARTIPSFIPERWLLSGLNFNYHFEHHMFPSVPSCHLPALHWEITAKKVDPKTFSRTYIATFLQLWKFLGQGI